MCRGASVDHKSDVVDDVATSDQHNKRGDASIRLVGTNRRMEFELIVAAFGDGDYSRQCGQDFMATPSHDRQYEYRPRPISS